MLAQVLITANRALAQNANALLGFTKFPSSPLMDRRFTLSRIDHDSRLLPRDEYGPCFSSVGANSSFEFATDRRLGVPLPHQLPLGPKPIFQRVSSTLWEITNSKFCVPLGGIRSQSTLPKKRLLGSCPHWKEDSLVLLPRTPWKPVKAPFDSHV